MIIKTQAHQPNRLTFVLSFLIPWLFRKKKKECYKVVSELLHTAKETLSQDVIPIPLVPPEQGA